MITKTPVHTPRWYYSYKSWACPDPARICFSQSVLCIFYWISFASFLSGCGRSEGRELVVIRFTAGYFVFLSSVVRVVPERQWPPNTSWVTSPECLVGAPKSRWVCNMGPFGTLSHVKCKRLHLLFEKEFFFHTRDAGSVSKKLAICKEIACLRDGDTNMEWTPTNQYRDNNTKEK